MKAKIIFFGIGLGCVVIFPFISPSPFYIHMVLMIFLYAAMGQSWNILGGFTGQVSLGHAMFFGTGAYSLAILLAKMDVNPWIGIIAGGVFAGIFSQVIAYPLLRLAGHYFAVATMVMNEIVQTLMINWDYCGGARGLWFPIKDEGFLNIQFSSKIPYYFIGFGLLCVVFILTRLVQKSKLGYYLRAIKDAPDTARSRGINTTIYKCISLAVSAFLMGMVGAYYAQYIFCIDPRSVYFIGLSINVMLIPILGGLGTLWGPMIGAVILIPLSEFSRAYLGGGEKAIDLLVYGLLIMIFAVYQPKGLMGFFQKRRRNEAPRS